MTDNEIKALSEKYANTVDWKLGSEFYSSHEMWTKAKEAFEAGYRAAIEVADGKNVWDIKYHSTYSVWDQRIESFLANSEDDALNQFWQGKNKESYDVMSVNKRQPI